MSSVNLAIIGTGVVGSAFLNQLSALKSSIKYNVILIARSQKSVISTDYKPIDISDWNSVVSSASQQNLSTAELLKFLKASPSPVILVDNTSDASIASSYPELVANGISVATPNKKAFSSDLATWNSLFNKQGLVYHEATVGAGLPIIGTINDMVSTGDQIETIEGIFSGTLSYIFNEYSRPGPPGSYEPVKFSDVVSVAKKLGYTEPDPRDDLNGLDVARKVTIVARLAGFKVESPTSFPVQSLIPKDLEPIESATEFMEKLPKYDYDIEKIKDDAAAEGKVLRFVGKVDIPNNTVSVGIQKYPYSHPFASLKGSDNVVSIKTKRYNNPLIVQGAGAGAEVTAAGVLADTIKIAQRVAK